MIRLKKPMGRQYSVCSRTVEVIHIDDRPKSFFDLPKTRFFGEVESKQQACGRT